MQLNPYGEHDEICLVFNIINFHLRVCQLLYTGVQL